MIHSTQRSANIRLPRTCWLIVTARALRAFCLFVRLFVCRQRVLMGIFALPVGAIVDDVEYRTVILRTRALRLYVHIYFYKL